MANQIQISLVTTKNDLIAVLRRFDIAVPLRTEGRKTHHVEKWTICRLLSTLMKNERLVYPMSLTGRERPDFLLQRDEAKVGIEATEAIPEQYASFLAFAESEFSDKSIERGHFRRGSPKLSKDEMRDLIRRERLTAPPWAGDRPEQEWAEYFQSVIEAKLLKLAKPGFEIFPENWLAIYDNLQLPNIDLEKAVGFLLLKLDENWACIPGFDAIYIEHGAVVVQLSPNKITYMELHDLW